jgi:predicted GIY-YIG superfamily endonuclease
MSWVYILKNEIGQLYIGSTVDLLQRVSDHKDGYSPFTSQMGLVELIFSQEYATLSEARSIERKLKRRDYIEKIVKDGLIKMKP